MKIINKYVLREHVGPLVFALTALTSLLLLNYIAKRFGDLVGKGLAWSVIGEFFLLSLPFTVAMTLPMAVLVATLYAFSRLAAENEITALKASGVSMVRVLIPVLVGATGIAAFMLFFNDQVLPRANHRLSTLQQDIARKKPTFALKEQVLNEVSPGRFSLRAERIDRSSSLMRGVTIYDFSDPLRRRTIFADSGEMTLTGNDLLLTLYDGHMQEVPKTEVTQLQRLFFDVDRIRVRNVVNTLVRSDTSNAYKGDREMSICEMQRQVARHELDFGVARYNLEQALVAGTRELVTGAPAQVPDPLAGIPPSSGLSESSSHAGRTVIPAGYEPDSSKGLGALYCRAIAQLKALDLPLVATAEAADLADRGPGTGDSAFQAQEQQRRDSARAKGDTVGASRRRIIMSGSSVPPRPVQAPAPAPSAARDSAVASAPGDTAGFRNAAVVPGAAGTPPGTPPGVTPGGVMLPGNSAIAGSVPVVVSSAVDAARARMLENRETMNQFEVEIHKKFALSVACIVFVLIGAPIALRFPRGGVGLVIGVSLVVFAIYYVGLIAGESLANRDILSPFWAMWAANIIMTIVGVVMMIRMGREGATSRGGDLSEFLEAIRGAIGRVGRRIGLPLERRHQTT